MSSTAATAPTTTGFTPDIRRQIGVIAATVFMIVAAMFGSGLFGGTPVQDLQSGALDSDGSWLAPARSAFSIWSVIYLLMIGYAVWQALPSQRANPRQRRIGGWIAVTAVLNGLWLVTAQYLTLWLTVLVIAVLLVALAITFRRTVVYPSEHTVDALLIDGTVGLHLGWVTVATVVNIAAWLTAIGPDSWVSAATVWGAIVLVVVAVIGMTIVAASGRLAPALAMGWGLVWIASARLSGEPQDAVVAVFALVAAALIVLPAVAGKLVRMPRRLLPERRTASRGSAAPA